MGQEYLAALFSDLHALTTHWARHWPRASRRRANVPRRTSVFVSLAVAASTLCTSSPRAFANAPSIVTSKFTGAEQHYVVPSGVRLVAVLVHAAAGLNRETRSGVWASVQRATPPQGDRAWPFCRSPRRRESGFRIRHRGDGQVKTCPGVTDVGGGADAGVGASDGSCRGGGV